MKGNHKAGYFWGKTPSDSQENLLFPRNHIAAECPTFLEASELQPREVDESLQLVGRHTLWRGGLALFFPFESEGDVNLEVQVDHKKVIGNFAKGYFWSREL